MNRRWLRLPLIVFCAAALTRPVGAMEGHGAAPKAEAPPPAPELPGLKKVTFKKPLPTPQKPLAVDGIKGVESFCGAVAASATSTRLAWQEDRVKALKAEMIVKIAELDAKQAEVRDWVSKREQLLAKAAESLTAIYARMRPEAASAQLQQMDDDTAAALLLKLKPAVASAVMSEMDPARAARLSDLLTGAAAKTEEKKS